MSKVNPQYDQARISRAHDYLMLLGNLTVSYTDVRRAPRYPSGERESDVEHSFHLAISAVELAADFYPDLDLGLVSQFSLVHDMPEIYAGDVWTFNITDEARAQKKIDEDKATKKLLKQLPPYLADLLERYEAQTEPEARFVRFVDKLLPAIINSMAGDESTFKEDYQLDSAEELIVSRDRHSKELLKLFPEFDVLHLIKELVFETSTKHAIDGTNYPKQF